MNGNIAAKDKKVRFELLALFSAFLWGTSFVAQKSAMLSLPPLLFTSLRFATALPVLIWMMWLWERRTLRAEWRKAFLYSLPPGLALAFASSLQQGGLVNSSASKGGFIVSLYVCIMPFLAVLGGYRLRLMEVFAAFLAISGIYLLVVSDFTIESGDLLLLVSAFGWALHILSVDYFIRFIRPLTLATFHVGYCILFTGLLALLFEQTNWNAIGMARWELFYAGPLAAGLSLGLQIFCQEHISPNRISLLVCMAVFFAALGGWLILAESLTTRELIGSALMIAALLIVRVKR